MAPGGAHPGRQPGQGRVSGAGTAPWPLPARSGDAPGPSWREVTERLQGEVTRVACGPGAVWGGLGQDGRIHRSVRGGSVGPGERGSGALGSCWGGAPAGARGGSPFSGMGGGRPASDGRDPSGEEFSSDRGERGAAGTPGQVITESQVHLGWKRPLGSSSPSVIEHHLVN